MAVLDRHTQPKYKRWQKLLKGLYIVKDVLSPHAETVLHDFHTNSLIGCLGAFCCFAPTLQLVLDKTSNKWKITGAPACTGYKRCPDWLDTIAAEHLQGNRKDLFKSCDLNQLNASSWEVGKTFLTPVQASGTNGPGDLDPYYLMKIITQCRLFSQPPHNIHNAMEKVLQTRNGLAHSAVQGINTDAEVTVKMDEMIDLVRLLPAVHASIIGDLEKVRDGDIDEISKELSPREVDIFRLFLQDAQQGSSEKMDLLGKKVEEGSAKATRKMKQESTKITSKVEGESAKVTSKVEEESTKVTNKLEEESAKVTSKVEEESAKITIKVEEAGVKITNKVEEESAMITSKVGEECTKVASEVQTVRQQVEEENTKVARKVEEESTKVTNKLEEESTKVTNKLEEESAKVTSKVDEESAKLASKMEELNQSVMEIAQASDKKRPGSPALDPTPKKSRKDDTLERLRAELVETYVRYYSKLQPVPWSADVSLPINLVYQAQTVTTGKGTSRHQGSSSELKCFFESSVEARSSPRRILIEGPPGMGKSTLCQQLIQVWARRVNASATVYQRQSAAPQDDWVDSSLHDFRLVFLIRVRELIKGNLTENLQENLINSCWKDKALTEKLESCINEHIKQVLLIVDGYDEGDEAQRTWVDSCLRGADCRGCMLIVTSRPEFCRPTAQAEQNPDRTYMLMGLDRVKQQDFASKFDQVVGVEIGKRSASEQLSQFLDQDFLQTPLLLALVCVLASQGEGVLPKTVSGLYNEFTEFLSHKAMRGPINFKEEEVTKLLKFLQQVAFNLFKQKKSEISFDLFKESDFESQIEETMDNICKLGLVQQEIKLKGLQNSQTGAFIHQSFLDFFAARHFVSVSKEERSALLKDTVIQENMLVLAAGLCGENEEQHHECFAQMLEAWDQAVQRHLEDKGVWRKVTHVYNHSVLHACFLWLTELHNPCWLLADHITAIYQTSNKASYGAGIRLGDYPCSASCCQGVVTLLEAAEHHRLHGSRHAPLDPATFKLTLFTNSDNRHTISTAAQIDLLNAACQYNVQLKCAELRLLDCLTCAQSDQLSAVLTCLTHLKYLTITASSWAAVNVVLRGLNSTSQLLVLYVYCSPSSPRSRHSPPAAAAVEDPWSPPDELLDNISRSSVLYEIELRDRESTVTSENQRQITRLFNDRLPHVRVKF